MMDVLIVDDSILANHALKGYFTKLGHNVVGIAKDGQQGMDLFSTHKPQIVTVDAIMPGNISGVDFIKYVNSEDLESGKTTRILFISSDEIKSEIKKEIQVDSYIVKPVTLSNIESALSES
ncbi:MAG: Chemotaxis protein CheY [Candidatus Heimdallarchaeota archaeon LC_2]|nr:MAG: Chemotaxis protein CheY [Candidatus Heimdallarchaeota archaeon LC_2]